MWEFCGKWAFSRFPKWEKWEIREMWERSAHRNFRQRFGKVWQAFGKLWQGFGNLWQRLATCGNIWQLAVSRLLSVT